MLRPVTVLLLTATLLSACASVSESRFNPLNWFGRSQPVAADPQSSQDNALIPARSASVFVDTRPESYRGTLVGEITSMSVERRPGGAVISVAGRADQVGAFDVRLVPDEEASTDTELVYTLRAIQPQSGSVRGPQDLNAGVLLTDQSLRGVRTIRVNAERNARAVQR